MSSLPFLASSTFYFSSDAEASSASLTASVTDNFSCCSGAMSFFWLLYCDKISPRSVVLAFSANSFSRFSWCVSSSFYFSAACYSASYYFNSTKSCSFCSLSAFSFSTSSFSAFYLYYSSRILCFSSFNSFCLACYLLFCFY